MATENWERFPRVPYEMIRHHMGWTNVGVCDEDVHAEFEALCAAAKSPDGTVGASLEESTEIIRYALECHHENRRMYVDVVLGRIGG